MQSTTIDTDINIIIIEKLATLLRLFKHTNTVIQIIEYKFLNITDNATMITISLSSLVTN